MPSLMPGPCSHGNNPLRCVLCDHARQKNLASFQGSIASAGKAIGKLSGGLSDGSGPGMSLDFDQVAEELGKRQSALVGEPLDLQPLRKPAEGEALVLRAHKAMTNQESRAFIRGVQTFWPGMLVFVLPPDAEITVECVSQLIEQLKALAARNELQRYDP